MAAGGVFGKEGVVDCLMDWMCTYLGGDGAAEGTLGPFILSGVFFLVLFL